MYPAIKLARSMMEKWRLVAVPNDKEPGFTVLPQEQYGEAHLTVLSGPKYLEFPWDFEPQPLFTAYCRLTRKVSQLEGDEDIKRHLDRSLGVEKTVWTNALKLTCKTHKRAGNVTFRNLHTAPRSMQRGLSLVGGQTTAGRS